MSSEYRSWAERDASANKTNAEASLLAAQAEQAKQAATIGAAQAQTAQTVETLRQAKLKKQLDDVTEDAADRKAERKEKQREASLDKGVAFKRLVVTIMALGLAASLPGQLSYFLELRPEGQPDAGPALYLLPVPFFLELLAWTSVKGTQWAARKGFARWPFWILTLVLAGFAGWINFTKGTAMFGDVAGWALASTSVFGPVLVEVSEFVEARTAGDNRTAAERRAEKAAVKVREAADRQRVEKIARQDAERAEWFPLEFAEYRRIMIANPLEAVDRDEAWNRAWDTRHRLPVGETAGTYASKVRAQALLSSVLADGDWTAESVAVDRLLDDLFGGDEGPSGAELSKPPKGGTGGSGSAAPGAPRESRTPLGRKGKQASGRTTPKTPEKPLDPADVAKVRKLAEAFGGPDKLSARNVREALGGGSNEYILRVRDAVKNSKGEDQ